MVKTKELKLTIENETYGEFKGFQITFDGFNKVPFRFSSQGFASLKYLLERLQKEFGAFKLIVSKDKKSSINKTKSHVKVTLKYDDALNLRRDFRRRYRVAGEKIVGNHLSMIYPSDFPPIIDIPELDMSTVVPAKIESIIFSNEHILRVSKWLPLLERYGITNLTALKELIVTGRKVFHYIHLENVLREFEKHLEENSYLEHGWQDFFKDNLLILNPGYIELIPKTNISLGTANLPDFLLLNIDGYVDVYEIKVPDTPLLSFDQNRNNYYWSSDLSQAISQVETYLAKLYEYKQALENEIRKPPYNIDLTILRPRGYIIAGHSNQLQETGKNDYFRLLNESLKNTLIVPYDSFLRIFKNLSEALKEVK